MNTIQHKFLLGITMILLLAASCNNNTTAKVPTNNSALPVQSIYDFTMKDIDGNEVSLSKYKGKIMVIVNTASQCGLVGQLTEIEAFYKQYKDKGVVVLGFPANNFLGQEPLSNLDIKAFCTKNYGVTFPMFSKISVKGNDMHPLYKYLTSKDENGVCDAPVKWNYQKFIIDKNGKVVSAVNPRTTVNDAEFMQYIDDLIK
ncbi:MAG TPA: glutathione peroxidase [Chitinophagales bacterium]|mgnify:CR=1 FL=1|jgi:glutathione peroxidase|nr:glutathione peroxidase [Chitinophagales bacterium]HQW79312.1 glutathione peroxidase [Chitinophagales bacterium]HRB67924.1 glutathione peroxidase [Chitinophagales bacterium]HRB93196.1 glutathione peroxidase [Chitinophagales bacterium]